MVSDELGETVIGVGDVGMESDTGSSTADICLFNHSLNTQVLRGVAVIDLRIKPNQCNG